MGLPVPGPGNAPLDPLLVVLAIDDGAATRAADPRDLRHRDVAALGRWLWANHRSETRVVIARTGRGPLRYSRPLWTATF